ncbi:conserved hypothetical protein [Neospora caninum Liverpool]|uniref:Uncharacterized protein n=1 Tax=Neospora caninum (strain Liverpool) TaxID=572307 RepID=F0V791_NEOCL|nr:conserved hypothetical protein [Neospora caninum Liverpool]CBZ49582.1 conserved hypothetical protein [Neospora caninum Liverpool]CEL64162.1 TPA: hypothetical protein BN1204_000760 [Neospora caninum Liverpool]|eukprot:XP_003879617.1 conserved hypothetical protein [Neospora caninum Liverpool]
MGDSSEELAKVEKERRKVEKELADIRRIEDSIRERQIEYLAPRSKSDDEKRIEEVVLNSGRLLTDALSLYGGEKVNFDQNRVTGEFKHSERAITKEAINTLFRWLDKADKEGVKETSKNLNNIRGTLAVMSGLRKHKWVELAEHQQQIRDSRPEKGELEVPIEERNKFLKHVDDYLVILERLRRLHWKEVEYLDDFGLQLQDGGFPDDDALQDYMYTTLLDRIKTYNGRYGFHNRSIALLDHYRRYYIDLRAAPRSDANEKAWEELRLMTSAFDEYKSFIFNEELEKGVTAGMWPEHAVPLFLY